MHDIDQALHHSVAEHIVHGECTDEVAVDYRGPGIDFVTSVADYVYGGQVVVTGATWKAVADTIPLQCQVGACTLLPDATTYISHTYHMHVVQHVLRSTRLADDATTYHVSDTYSQVLSLGTHVLSPRFSAPTMLMEVMPQMLARRTFPTLRTECLLVPGFRESPDPDKDMAILFCKAHKPDVVEQAEAAAGTEAWVVDVLTVYNLAVMELEEEVRDLLLVYGGYECKEPEPGKFTIAFSDLEMAVRWACALQLRLLDRPWPPALLQWDECAPVEGAHGLLWRGLRVRVGMAYGRPDQRKPLNTGAHGVMCGFVVVVAVYCTTFDHFVQSKTGRADYFGTLPNLAARVCAQAAPGQVLLDCHPGVMKAMPWTVMAGPHEDGALVALLGHEQRGGSGIEMVRVGQFVLKGFEDRPTVLCEVRSRNLGARVFPTKKPAKYEYTGC